MRKEIALCPQCGLNRVVYVSGGRKECSACGALVADAPGQPLREPTRASELHTEIDRVPVASRQGPRDEEAW